MNTDKTQMSFNDVSTDFGRQLPLHLDSITEENPKDFNDLSPIGMDKKNN